jgi:hypothetical protein
LGEALDSLLIGKATLVKVRELFEKKPASPAGLHPVLYQTARTFRIWSAFLKALFTIVEN